MEIGRTGRMRDEELLAVVRHLLNGEADRGDRHVDDQIDLVGVVPLPRNACRYIGLDLMIGGNHRDGLPKTLPPKSSTAICAAAIDPGPVAVAAGPDTSVNTPIFTTSSEI